MLSSPESTVRFAYVRYRSCAMTDTEFVTDNDSSTQNLTISPTGHWVVG